jgi:hypothetical protein
VSCRQTLNREQHAVDPCSDRHLVEL